MYDVVIAKYSEDLSWLDQFKEVNREKSMNTFIYDKSRNPSPEHIPLPNVGREADTYLHHICNHYDSPSECLILLQGNPREHTNVPVVKWKLPDSSAITKLTAFFTNIITETHHEDPGQSKYGLPVVQKSRQYFNVSPVTVSFAAGAQYIVPYAVIRKRPKHLYEMLYQHIHKHVDLNWDSAKDRVSHVKDDELDAWTMERLWPLLLS